VFHVKDIPEKFSPAEPLFPHQLCRGIKEPTPQELSYAVYLHTSSHIEIPANPVNLPLQSNDLNANANISATFEFVSDERSYEKTSLIENVERQKFYDLTVQVVKVYSASLDRVELYVTDYTENEGLYNYGQKAEGRDGDDHSYIQERSKDWNGPLGRRTLQVCLYDSHAEHAHDKVKVDDIVLLKNVRIKDGKGLGSMMDGAMHGDKRFPQKHGIVPLKRNDGRVIALLTRKQKYWDQNKGHEQDTKKRKAETEGRKEKKVRKKQGKKENVEQGKKITDSLQFPELKPNALNQHGTVAASGFMNIDNVDNIGSQFDALMQTTP
jgi:protection of telomeres protein 1